MTASGLLNSFGLLFVHIPESGADGVLFRVVADGYLFEARIAGGRVLMNRNGYEVSCPLARHRSNPPGPPPTALKWAPDQLKILTVDEISAVPTPVAFVPQSLLDWAQRESIAPVSHYESPQMFFGAVVDALVGVQERGHSGTRFGTAIRS